MLCKNGRAVNEEIGISILTTVSSESSVIVINQCDEIQGICKESSNKPC